MLYDLPNILTVSRILAIPVFCAAFWLPPGWGHWIPLGIFIAAGVTDYFDGYLARRYNQQSAFGRFLDPVADKLLVASALLMLVAFDRVTGLSVIAAVVILCREILVTGLREFLAELRVPLPVTQLAKWKTALQLIAIGTLIAAEATPAWTYAVTIGDTMLWLAAILTLYTGYDYLLAALKPMTQSREPRP